MKKSHLKIYAAVILATTLFAEPSMANHRMSLEEIKNRYCAELQNDQIIINALKLPSPKYKKPLKMELKTKDRLDIPKEYISTIAALSSFSFFSRDMLQFFIKEHAGNYSFMSDKIADMVLDLVAEPIDQQNSEWFRVMPNVGLSALSITQKTPGDIEQAYSKIVDSYCSYCRYIKEAEKSSENIDERGRFNKLAELYAIKSLGVKIVHSEIFQRCVQHQLYNIEKIENALEDLNNQINTTREPLAMKIEEKIKTYKQVESLRADVNQPSFTI